MVLVWRKKSTEKKARIGFSVPENRYRQSITDQFSVLNVVNCSFSAFLCVHAQLKPARWYCQLNLGLAKLHSLYRLDPMSESIRSAVVLIHLKDHIVYF